MNSNKAKSTFPTLNEKDIKYCAVFYEAQHNDARTNIAIALSAAEHGAAIANYVEMIQTITDPTTGKVIGVQALDRMTGRTFAIKAKRVVLLEGPLQIDYGKWKSSVPTIRCNQQFVVPMERILSCLDTFVHMR